MKIKHIFYGLFALLIAGTCLASPLVISAMQNRNLLNAPMRDSAVTTGVDITQRELSHMEKLSLSLRFNMQDSSVTRTTQRQNNTSLQESEVETIAKTELSALCSDLGIGIDPASLDQATVTTCYPVTYVDRDDPSCHAIFWIILLETTKEPDPVSVSMLMDDETHKLYGLTGVSNQINNRGEPQSEITVDTLLSCAETFGKSLNFSVSDVLDVHVDGTYETAQGCSAVVVYSDAQGTTANYDFQFDSGTYFLIQLQNLDMSPYKSDAQFQPTTITEST